MNVDPGLAAWLELTLTPGLGAAAMRTLLREFGLPEMILALDARTLERHLSREVLATMKSVATREAVDRALNWACEPHHAIVTLADENYPKALLEIPDPPPVLYAIGRCDLLHFPALAMVGSRNATPQGERNAHSFAKALSDAGLTIVSGLALGIDTAAHRGGLAGASSTIAFLGTGVDIAYPRSNSGLAGDIAERGLLLSEFPLGTPPAAHNFPRRNRLISGVSQGCIVVEAALASGSLITARAAADQGREVFAVPGSIHSPLSKGCHALIKTGAKLVESADDVLGELGGFSVSGVPIVENRTIADRTAHEDGLLAHMGHDPIDVDTLCSRAGIPVDQVSSELLRLELGGHVASLPGGLYQRVGKEERR